MLQCIFRVFPVHHLVILRVVCYDVKRLLLPLINVVLVSSRNRLQQTIAIVRHVVLRTRRGKLVFLWYDISWTFPFFCHPLLRIILSWIGWLNWLILGSLTGTVSLAFDFLLNFWLFYLTSERFLFGFVGLDFFGLLRGVVMLLRVVFYLVNFLPWEEPFAIGIDMIDALVEIVRLAV